MDFKRQIVSEWIELYENVLRRSGKLCDFTVLEFRICRETCESSPEDP